MDRLCVAALAVVTVAVVGSCGPSPSPAAPTAPAPTAAPAATTPTVQGGSVKARDKAPALSGRYVGETIVVATWHGGQTKLLAGMEAIGTTRFASGAILQTARLGDDLVVLLAAETGVIADDITLEGQASAQLVTDCHDDAFLGIAAPKACEGVRSVEPLVAFDIRGGQLEKKSVVCSCDLVNLD